MKKVYIYLMTVFAALFAMVSFVACSSDDDDSQQIYTKGVTKILVSGASTKAWGQIEAAYDAKLGKASPFQGESDAKVKALADEAERTMPNLDWEETTGTLTYTITNVTSGKTIYSKTFNSEDGSNQFPAFPKTGYSKGITEMNITGNSTKVLAQINAAYNAKLGSTSVFLGNSDSKVKALAEEAEKTISVLGWGDVRGTLTYTVKNLTTGSIIYSKTFSN